MKKILISVIILTAAILTAFVVKGPLNIEPIAIGTKAPMTDYKMAYPDESGSASLADLKEENGILVVFSCNTCPFVLGWEDRYNDLQATASDNDIAMVLLNSNAAKRTGDDAPNKMLIHAREQKYNMPYLIDADSKLADAFGARTTPHVFLFDKEMTLVYEGAIDDNYKSKANATKHYTSDALKALGAGKKIKEATTPAKGCSIKRVKA